jgi:signal transduction histidine kinase
MGTLIDDLLRVERIRTSPLELHEQVDIEALVKIVLVNTRYSAQTKNHKMASELDLPKSPRLNADPVLIRQAMENLINNAIKYSDKGGKITVRAYVEGPKFHFSVADTGIGIASEHLPFVFEPFFRVNASAPEKGSGLGLSLVKTVIERHHGEVWVKSQSGKGSQFGFWLPLVQPEDDKAAS